MTGVSKQAFNEVLQQHQQGELEAARAGYQALLEVEPAHAECLHLLGVLAHQQTRHQDALTLISKALEQNQDNALYWSNLAEVQYALGTVDEAISSSEKAISLEPRDAVSHNNLGVSYKNKGRLELALTAFSRALFLKPDYVQAAQSLMSILNKVAERLDDKTLERLALQCLGVAQINASQFMPVISAMIERRYYHAIREPLTAERVQSLTSDKFLLMYLTTGVNAGPQLELFLVQLRCWLLFNCEKLVDKTGKQALLVAMATQAFNNEYVWFVSAAEQQALAKFEENPSETGSALLVACYRPLTAINSEWSDQMDDLLERSVRQPQKEVALKSTIETIGAIEDTISQAVALQYEENPYPRWLDLTYYHSQPLAFFARQMFPNAEDAFVRLDSPVSMLVAGCGTGKQPLGNACGYSDVEITAIDLSLTSLAYAKREAMTRKITNIDFYQCDLLSVAELGQTFDMIECGGVLHHLQEPEQGLRALLGVLNPGGVLRIALYSKRARRVIADFRKRLASRLTETSLATISALRHEILSAGGRGECARLTGFKDFYSVSGFRDLVLHVQEHTYTFLDIKQLLEQNQLQLIGLELGPDDHRRQAFEALHPEPSARTDLAAWDSYEQDHPDDFNGMITFWCQAQA